MPLRVPTWEVVLRVVVLVALGGLYVWWALSIPYEPGPFVDSIPENLRLAPDEGMRIDLLSWIVGHGTLPLGTEPELIDNVWGFSYGLTAYGSTIAALPLALAAHAFGAGTLGIVLAARLTDVCFAVATLALAFRVSDRLFSHASARFLFVLLLGLLPQFGYIASYFNCEAMAVFCVMLTVLMLMRGVERGWRWIDAICLGIALGVTALSYYFAYGVFPVSILVYYVTCARTRRAEGTFRPLRDMVGKPLVIAGVAFAVCGWFFIRNLALHGDFFGFSTVMELSEANAIERLKPSNRPLAKNVGVSLPDMLFGLQPGGDYPWDNMSWFQSTFQSTVGKFGWMAYSLGDLEYAAYLVFLSLGFGCGVARLIVDGVTGANRFPYHWLVVGSTALMVVATFGFSVYYSWVSDYQAQGRYIMACVPFMLFVVALGYGGGRFRRTEEGRSTHLARSSTTGLQGDVGGLVERVSTVMAVAAIVLWTLLFLWVLATFIAPDATAPLFP